MENEQGESRLGKDDVNIAEFPLTQVTQRPNKNIKELVFSDQVKCPKTKLPVCRTLTVTTAKGHIPGSVGENIVVALIQITWQKKFSKQLCITRYELLKALGCKRPSGAHYREFEEKILPVLKQMAHCSYEFTNAWYDWEERTWVSKIFHLYSITYDETNKADARITINWADECIDHFINGVLADIDLQLLFALKSPVAKRMYRYLNKYFNNKAFYTNDLRVFCCEHIGLSRNLPTAKLKERIAPHIKTLQRKGIIKDVPLQEIFLKRDKQTSIRVQRAGSRKQTTVEKDPKQIIGVDQPKGVIQELTKRGLSSRVACQVGSLKTESELLEICEFFDRELKAGRINKNPGGWLRCACEGDIKVPSDFPSEKKRMERKCSEDAVEIRKRQQELEERERQKREVAYYNTLLASMPLAEKEQFVEQALRNAAKCYQPYINGEGLNEELNCTIRRHVIREELTRVFGEYAER